MPESEWNTTGSRGKTVAMLIDGDNAQPALMDAIVEEAMRYGHMTFRRVYGDWTAQNMSGWKSILQDHAIQPIQQFRNTTGKNATDSALIIDAMDILHTEDVDNFVIVTSDSDFTRLATRLREAGKMAIGIGERKRTPKPFVKACNIFVYTENLVLFGETDVLTASVGTEAESRVLTHDLDELIALLKKALDHSQCDDGSCLLSQVGIALHKIDPGFDPRTYGKKKLLDLIEMFPDTFEVSSNVIGGPMSIWLKDGDSCEEPE